ncbi:MULTISPECIES: hypothetical protein [Planktothricoides]|nr:MULTISPECIES: hypothetical protein [Planktothricoides]
MAIRPCTGEWPFAPTAYNIRWTTGMLRPYGHASPDSGLLI